MSHQPISPENIYHIGSGTANELWHAAFREAADFAPDYHFTDEGVAAATETARALAAKCLQADEVLWDAAATLNQDGNSQDVMLVRGLPVLPEVDRIEVQDDNTLPDDAARAMSLVALTITTLFGPPIGYRKSDGTVSTFLRQVAPSPEPSTSIVGTTRAGDWHTEFGPSAYKPSTVLLTGVRAGDAVTRFMPAGGVIAHLERTDPLLLEKLREPRYATPTKFVSGEQTAGPLVADTDSGPALVLGENYREAQDPDDTEALAAIDALAAVLQRPELSLEHRIMPGEAFAFRNQTGLHARSAFNDQKRWLMRTFAGRPGMSTVVEYEDVLKT